MSIVYFIIICHLSIAGVANLGGALYTVFHPKWRHHLIGWQAELLMSFGTTAVGFIALACFCLHGSAAVVLHWAAVADLSITGVSLVIDKLAARRFLRNRQH